MSASERRCAQCGAPYTSSNPRRIYCDRRCAKRAEARRWGRLRNDVWSSSYYWFARIILGLDARRANAFRSGQSFARWLAMHRGRARHWWRRRYHALRAQGLSAYAADARLKGWTAAQVRRAKQRRERRIIARWGGYPYHVGSEAWKRWVTNQPVRGEEH